MPGRGIFEEALGSIREAKRLRESGGVNSIPFGLASLDRHVPGVMGGIQYLITASSGVGKTQLSKFLFVNQPYKFIKEHPELGIKIKILYFALEESKQEFMYSLISNRLKEKHDVTISVMQLMGINFTVPDDTMAKIEECKAYFEELEGCIDVIDTISNPTGIYKYVEGYATDHGTHHYKPHVFRTSHSNGSITEETKMIMDYYEATDPKEIVVVIVDHASLLQPETIGGKATSLHEAMTYMSANYGRKHITKHYKYCLAIVQQQAADTEKQQYTSAGQSIEAKLEPSLNGLGDNKLTQRDAFIVIGLFAPERYQIDKHMGYDVKILKDFYRCLMILKNRMGTPNTRLALLFNGISNIFSELPKPGTPELRTIYETIERHRTS